MFALESAGNHKEKEAKKKSQTGINNANTNTNQNANTHFTFILMTITELVKCFLSNHQALSLFKTNCTLIHSSFIVQWELL